MIQLANILFLIVRYGAISAFFIAVFTPLLRPMGIDIGVVASFFEQFDAFRLPDPQVSATVHVVDGPDYTYVGNYEFAITKLTNCVSVWSGNQQGRCGSSINVLVATLILVGFTFAAAVMEIRFAWLSLWNKLRKITKFHYAHKFATASLAGYSIVYWHFYKFTIENTVSDSVWFSNAHLVDEQAVYAGFTLIAAEIVFAFGRNKFQDKT